MQIEDTITFRGSDRGDGMEPYSLPSSLRGAGDKSTWTAPAVTFQPMGVLWTSAPRSKGLEELFLAMATCCFPLAVIQS